MQHRQGVRDPRTSHISEVKSRLRCRESLHFRRPQTQQMVSLSGVTTTADRIACARMASLTGPCRYVRVCGSLRRALRRHGTLNSINTSLHNLGPAGSQLLPIQLAISLAYSPLTPHTSCSSSLPSSLSTPPSSPPPRSKGRRSPRGVRTSDPPPPYTPR